MKAITLVKIESAYAIERVNPKYSVCCGSAVSPELLSTMHSSGMQTALIFLSYHLEASFMITGEERKTGELH